MACSAGEKTIVAVISMQNPIKETAKTISEGISEFLNSICFDSLKRLVLIYDPPVLSSRRIMGCGCGMGIGVGIMVATCRFTFGCEAELKLIGGSAVMVG